jgi:hypothetical protein
MKKKSSPTGTFITKMRLDYILEHISLRLCIEKNLEKNQKNAIDKNNFLSLPGPPFTGISKQPKNEGLSPCRA